MKTAPVIGLLIVSLLLWAATSPSASVWGETRLDDIIRAVLGVAPKQVDPNSVLQGGGAGVPTVILPNQQGQTKPGSLPALSGIQLTVPGNSVQMFSDKGLFQK